MSLGNFISSEHVIWFSILRWKQNEFGERELQGKKDYTPSYIEKHQFGAIILYTVYNNNALKCQNCFYQKRIQIRLFSFFFIRLSRLCYLQNTWITTNVRCNHFGHMYYIKLCLLRIFHWTKKKQFFETCARAVRVYCTPNDGKWMGEKQPNCNYLAKMLITFMCEITVVFI